LLRDPDGGGTAWADEGQRSQREEVCIFCGSLSSYLPYGSIYVDIEGLYSTKSESYLQGSNIRKSFRYPSRASFRFPLRFTLQCLLALCSDTSCRPFIRILIYSTWPSRPLSPPSLIMCGKGTCSMDWSPVIFNRAKHRRDDIPFHFRSFLQLSQPARVKDWRHSIPLSSEELHPPTTHNNCTPARVEIASQRWFLSLSTLSCTTTQPPIQTKNPPMSNNAGLFHTASGNGWTAVGTLRGGWGRHVRSDRSYRTAGYHGWNSDWHPWAAGRRYVEHPSPSHHPVCHFVGGPSLEEPIAARERATMFLKLRIDTDRVSRCSFQGERM